MNELVWIVSFGKGYDDVNGGSNALRLHVNFVWCCVIQKKLWLVIGCQVIRYKCLGEMIFVIV